MSKFSKLFNSTLGKVLLPLGHTYLKRKSKHYRKARPLFDLVLELHQSGPAAKKTIPIIGIINAPTTTTPTGTPMNFVQRVTSRKFLATVAAATSALGIAYAAWQTEGIPVSQKVDLTMIAIVAVAAVVAAYTTSEGKIDQAAVVANATK